MSIKTKHTNLNVAYFVTFTCYKWLPLIEKSNAYNSFLKWFDYLNSIDIKPLGFVIMPNHFHGIFYIPEYSKRNINTIVANGKILSIIL